MYLVDEAMKCKANIGKNKKTLVELQDGQESNTFSYWINAWAKYEEI